MSTSKLLINQLILNPMNNHIKLLDEIATKVIELWKQMDKTFLTTETEQHLKIAIMAGLVDAVNSIKPTNN